MATNADKSYRAVTITTCSESCAAAQAHSGKMLLIKEFEQIILKHCREPLCRCEFQQHADRRSGIDRRYVGPNTSQPISTHNRRMNYGRRADDVHNRARDNTGEIDLSKALFEFLSQ